MAIDLRKVLVAAHDAPLLDQGDAHAGMVEHDLPLAERELEFGRRRGAGAVRGKGGGGAGGHDGSADSGLSAAAAPP